MSERHPIGYLGELVDVANAVLFLASDELDLLQVQH